MSLENKAVSLPTANVGVLTSNTPVTVQSHDFCQQSSYVQEYAANVAENTKKGYTPGGGGKKLQKDPVGNIQD